MTSKSRVGIATQALRIPPHLFFVGSAIFHYLGPSFAVLLFPAVGVLGVAWLRIGATKPIHLDEALNALSIQLQPDDCAALEHLYVPHPMSFFRSWTLCLWCADSFRV
jgi:hypothetical protein